VNTAKHHVRMQVRNSRPHETLRPSLKAFRLVLNHIHDIATKLHRFEARHQFRQRQLMRNFDLDRKDGIAPLPDFLLDDDVRDLIITDLELRFVLEIESLLEPVIFVEFIDQKVYDMLDGTLVKISKIVFFTTGLFVRLDGIPQEPIFVAEQVVLINEGLGFLAESGPDLILETGEVVPRDDLMGIRSEYLTTAESVRPM
jgi:hypothetical protein